MNRHQTVFISESTKRDLGGLSGRYIKRGSRPISTIRSIQISGAPCPDPLPASPEEIPPRTRITPSAIQPRAGTRRKTLKLLIKSHWFGHNPGEAPHKQRCERGAEQGQPPHVEADPKPPPCLRLRAPSPSPRFWGSRGCPPLPPASARKAAPAPARDESARAAGTHLGPARLHLGLGEGSSRPPHEPCQGQIPPRTAPDKAGAAMRTQQPPPRLFPHTLDLNEPLPSFLSSPSGAVPHRGAARPLQPCQPHSFQEQGTRTCAGDETSHSFPPL